MVENNATIGFTLALSPIACSPRVFSWPACVTNNPSDLSPDQ